MKIKSFLYLVNSFRQNSLVRGLPNNDYDKLKLRQRTPQLNITSVMAFRSRAKRAAPWRGIRLVTHMGYENMYRIRVLLDPHFTLLLPLSSRWLRTKPFQLTNPWRNSWENKQYTHTVPYYQPWPSNYLSDEPVRYGKWR